MSFPTNFPLHEFTDSDTATEHGIDNTPPVYILPNLKALAQRLQQVRNYIATKHGIRAIIISSGYRCPPLNNIISKTKSSQHQLGLAADITVIGWTPEQLAKVIQESGVSFDQCIIEKSTTAQWVHFSIQPAERNHTFSVDA